VSFDRSEVDTSYGAYSFAFNISFLCRIFRFSRFGVVCLLCESIDSIRLSACSSCRIALYDPSTAGNGDQAKASLAGKC
jgi:hypothetical protein